MKKPNFIKRGVDKLKLILKTTSKFKLILLGVLIALLILLIPTALDPYITRNMLIAIVAHRHIGEPIHFEASYYSDVYRITEWGMNSNSHWLLEQVRYIVPYMGYEKLAVHGRYPEHTIFGPYRDNQSFHTMGSFIKQVDLILLNERFLTDQKWNDKVRAFSTLVHELIHAQGGIFLADGSENLESATSAATVELLAAMCNHGNDVACRGFWREIRGMSWTAASLRLHEHNLDWLGDVLYKLLFLDREREWRYEKSMRFWADDPDALWAIEYKYNLSPWEKHLIPGVNGQTLDTKIRGLQANLFGWVVVDGDPMPFDDTIARIGWLRLLMHGGGLPQK